MAGFQKKLDRYRSLLWLLGGAILFRLVFLVINSFDPAFAFPQSDAENYLELGKLLRAGDFLNPRLLYTSPLYPLLVAAFGSSLSIAIFQMSFGIIATLAVYGLARQQYRRSAVGLWAAALFTLHGPLIFYETKVYPTALTIDLLLIALFLLNSVTRTVGLGSAARKLWMGGAALALATGLTPALLPLYLLIALFYPLPGKRLPALGRFCLPLFLLLALLGWRSLIIDGHWLPLGANRGLNLAQGHHPEADGHHYTLPGFDGTKLNQQRDAKTIAERTTGRQLSWYAVDAYWQQQAVQFIRDNGRHEFQLLRNKLLLFFSDIPSALDISFLYDSQRLPVLKLLAVSFTLLFGLALLSRRWPRGITLAFLTILFGNLSFFVSERYRLPAAALLTIPAGAGIYWCLQLTAKKRLLALAVIGAALLFELAAHLPPSENRLYDFNLALAYENSGEPDRALQLLLPIHAYKKSPVAAHAIARIYLQRQQLHETTALILTTFSARGESPTLLNDLGIAYLRLNETAKARAAFDKALHGAPEMTVCYRNRGLVELRANRFTAALPWLQKYSQLNPSDWRIWVDLAKSYIALHRFDEAEAALAAGKKIANNDLDSLVALVGMGDLVRELRAASTPNQIRR